MHIFVLSTLDLFINEYIMLQILNLDKNQLSSLPINTIERLQKAIHLKELSLSENPWRCDCSAAELQNFLKTKYQKVRNQNKGSFVMD